MPRKSTDAVKRKADPAEADWSSLWKS